MNLNHYKILLVAIGLVGILILATPVLGTLIVIPGSERYSELYLLGPQQTTSNIPYNVLPNQTYTIYLGVGNHMGESQYYLVDAKLRNQSQSFPNETSDTSSSLQPVYQYREFIGNEGSWQTPVDFSISNISVVKNEMVLGTISIMNSTSTVNLKAIYDTKNQGYYYEVFFELWSLNPNTGSFQFQDRSVYFWIRLAAT